MEQSAALQETVRQVSTATIHFTISRYVVVAGYVIMLYDHATTFSDEVELIWKKPMNPVSLMFLINRYGVPVVLAIDLYDKGGLATYNSKRFCESWLWIESYSQILFHSVTHALIAIRVRALWQSRPTIDRALGISFALYLTATLVIVTVGNVPLSAEIHFNELFHMCFADEIAHWFYWVWVPALLFEAVLFVLTSMKAVQYHRRKMVMPVTQILYRDGILYFQVIAICTAFNIIAWTAFPHTLVAVAKYFTFSMVTTMGSKLVLNIRAIRKEDDVMVHQQPASSGLPVFELSQLKSSDTLRNEYLSFGVSSQGVSDIKAQRFVDVDTQRSQKIGSESSELFDNGPQGDLKRTGSFNSVHVRVEVHVDADANGEDDWDIRVEDDKVDEKMHDRW